ncbi:IS5/IS1182 family transposase [Micromonospora peucetia]|uniref:Helix-turn-helix of DDE superfamily endonuclease n=1 Tax=Micromonospora peucetia TaxID=47871 RepID=A0A1C6W4H1_9ACTN|nr:IS5/IS1182 family transposase [Micromonospora peucetia]SCL73418.1 Helix-turn-helix of DDE superfamily endonuclease [Micromonospora peucetia]
MIAYSARLDAPRELVQHVARLLHAEHRAMGIRSGTRTSTCFHQAILALVRSRKGADKTTLGTGFGVSRATVYRHVAEAVRVPAAQTPTLHDALRRRRRLVARHELLDSDCLVETTVSAKVDTIDAWYSGKHRDFGANIQTVTRPDGLPAWASDAMPGHLHDLISPNGWTSPGPPTGAASKLGLPTRATKALARASALGTSSPPPAAAGSRSATALPMPPFDRCDASGDAAPRFSSVFWRTLRHSTARPRQVGDSVHAALHLTHFKCR